VTAALLVLAGTGAACSSGPNTDPGASAPESSSASPSDGGKPSDTPTSTPDDDSTLAGPGEFTVHPATKPYGLLGAPVIARADDGTTILVYEPNWNRHRTSYRLYDRNWRPRTPLLRVEDIFEVHRGARSGFLGLAGEPAQWVTIERDGRIRPVAHQPSKGDPARPTRPGDLHLEGDAAYRPSTDTVIRKPKPPWDRLSASWYDERNGMICVLRSGPLATNVIHVSRDEGRTFTDIPLADVIPAESGPRAQSCDTTGTRIVVGTGGENPEWLHTLSADGRHRYSSRPLGDALDPYSWDTLPDGRLVTGTNRPGLMVGTDSTNQLMDHRPGPVPPFVGFDVVDGDVLVVGPRRVKLSQDAGRTWRTIDLDMP
jgi:hypothetical protein